MRQIFISSVQKEFERERAAIKKMIESDPIIKPHFKAFVFEIDAPASDKSTQQVYLEEIEKSDIYLVLVGDQYGYCQGDEPSPTEQEYNRAEDLNLAKLVMVRGFDNSKRDTREAAFLNRISNGRVRIRFQDPESNDTMGDLLDEVRNSIRDIMLDEGIMLEVPFEDGVSPDRTLADIDDDRVRWFAEKAVRNRKAKYSSDMSVSDILRSLHLLNCKLNLPTNAAMLLFGRDVQGPFPSSQIKCICYRGVEKGKPALDAEMLEGDLFELADQAVAFIKKHLNFGVGVHGRDTAADDVYEMPNSVIVEAVNNAVAHRNYSNVGSIQVEVYKDRVEIINPGRLHPALTISDLYKKHESYPPNQRIAHVMYFAKYIETIGTGITDLLRDCRKAKLKRPVLEELSGRFRIVLWRQESGNKLEIISAKLIECVKNNPKCSVIQYAEMIGCENKDVKRAIARLQNANVLVHEGAKKNGVWRLMVKG